MNISIEFVYELQYHTNDLLSITARPVLFIDFYTIQSINKCDCPSDVCFKL